MKETPESINRLLLELQSNDEFTRAQASFALGMLGEPAVQPLIGLLSHKDRDVRMRAAWSLGVIGQPALPALLELADGSDPDLRIEAIRVLGILGEGRSLNHLFHALTDPDARIAQRSAMALGRIGDVRAFHPLLTALHHPAPDVRFAASAALARLGLHDAIPPLNELAASDTEQTTWGASVAEAARRAIAEIHAADPPGSPSAFERLHAIIQDNEREPR